MIERIVVGSQKFSLYLAKTVAFINNFVNRCFFEVEIAIDIICDKMEFIRDAKFKRKLLAF